ncbi:hypothetical protein A0H81_02780 [Grifola frondosa]|uniref:Uncharacterized protein n=1 Tax=Grifola frondosa TaxID=5627 RepID=A0A1C7MMK4_GRIFR|nr:hypothetical protein A0H81_02780 [Grifola frondosa]
MVVGRWASHKNLVTSYFYKLTDFAYRLVELFAIECVRAVKAPTLRLRSIHVIEILAEVEIFGRRTKDNATRQPDCDVWPRAKTQPQLEPPRFDINFVALSDLL